MEKIVQIDGFKEALFWHTLGKEVYILFPINKHQMKIYPFNKLKNSNLTRELRKKAGRLIFFMLEEKVIADEEKVCDI